jgi:hypothetical protein
VDIVVSFGVGRRTFEPHPYGHAVHTVSKRILNDPDVLLEIELGADDICGPCAHNVDGSCNDTIDTSYRPQAPPSKKEWNLLIDGRWCERLGIHQGDRLTARELCERIRDRAGDITDIYQELPPDMVAERSARLAEGLEFCPKR